MVECAPKIKYNRPELWGDGDPAAPKATKFDKFSYFKIK